MGHHAQEQNIVWLPSTDGIVQMGKRTVGVRAGDMMRRVALSALRLPWTTWRAYRTWYRCRQALHDLRQADPRLLRDIGLDQADLWHAVRHGRVDRPDAPGNWQRRP
ncbi:hypothetical protein ACFOGJ_23950 [Marinibaculum pumilum]|uniref:DUF1127 domain-containing protein n=1 Tax=Marinibaculum pumilum TaxID=1766165 RepID=A0ABV7L7J8_9PROT